MKTKVIKKTLSILLALATLLSVTAFGFGANAKNADPLFTLSDVETRQGEEFEVTVKIARDISPKGDKIAALDVSLLYDSNTFEPVDLVRGDGLNKAIDILSSGTSIGLDKGDYVYSCSKKTPGAVKWCMSTLDSFTFESGLDFMVIRFKAKDHSSLEGDLNMKIVVTNASAPDFTSKTDNYGSYTNSVRVDANLTTLCEWKYDEKTDGYELLKYNGENATYFTVPDVYDDESDEHGELPVTIIGTGAFRGSDTIEKITLGRNIKAVNSASFMQCSNLKRVVFYSTDVKIGASAFALTNEELVIKCIKGSSADKYARANNIKVEYFEDVFNCTYTGADEVIHYTGSPVELSNLKIFNAENEQLTFGTDYTLEYTDNVDIGTATVTVTGRGEYLGQKEITFEILCPYHNFESGYYTETAVYTDCEAGGKIIKNCSFCGYYDDSEAAPAKPHGECTWQEVKSPTCGEEGISAYVCADCGKHVEEKPIEKLAHANLKWVVTEEATCQKEGTESQICEDCGTVVATKSIEKIPHSYSDWIVTKEPTCTQPGTEKIICTQCGDVQIEREVPAKGHSWSETYVTVKEATCQDDGEEAIVCLACGETKESRVIPASGHTWSEDFVIVKEATCTEDGEKAIICTKCNAVDKAEVIPASGHTWSEDYVIVKEATCTEDGEKAIICTKCDAVNKTEVIPASGHTEPAEWTVIKEATCTEDGTKVKDCTSCGQKLKEEAIPANGHTETGEWVTVKAATCTENGEEKMLCSVCSETVKTRVIEAQGHKSTGVWVWEKKVTCTEDGVAKMYCSVCSEVLSSKTVKAPGHLTDDEWVVVVEPTCELKGLKHKVCKRCGVAAETEEIEALGHQAVWVTVTLPTYRYTGLEKSVCSVCGKDLKKTRVIAKVYPDVDGNNRVSSSDALLILQFATGVKSPTDEQKKKADVNGDGKVNSTDALLILQIATGVISVK